MNKEKVYVDVLRGALPDSCPKCNWGLMCNWNEPSKRGNCINPDCDYGYIFVEPECKLSRRQDGKHTFRFDGDDPYVECVFCGTVQDALTGRILHV